MGDQAHSEVDNGTLWTELKHNSKHVTEGGVQTNKSLIQESLEESILKGMFSHCTSSMKVLSLKRQTLLSENFEQEINKPMKLTPMRSQAQIKVKISQW